MFTGQLEKNADGALWAAVRRHRADEPGKHGRLRPAVRWTLARAHARAGARIAIAAYLGKSPAFDNAIAHFGETYADQNERDHTALLTAVADGRAQARSGV